jgi:F-type H+-transporting ATPase subunit a
VALFFLQHIESSVDSAHVVADSAHESEGGLFTHLLQHVRDSHELETPFGTLNLPHLQFFGVDMSITKHVVFLWLSALVLIVTLIIVARRNSKTAVPKGFGNLIEVFVEFVRDEIVLPNMGPEGMKYISYILTTFFFILLMNLFGLLPYGASATANVSVTAGLAVIAFIMIQISAIREQGMKHYLAHLTGGVHWIMWPIMIPLEVLGLFTKAFALCIRLFANMSGGHIVIVSLLGLIFIFKSYIVAPASVTFVVGLNMLELFVAFLQAYIFTILTAIFMGLGMQSEEHESREHSH